MHQALLFRPLSDDVIYFSDRTVLGDAAAARLTARSGFLAGLGLQASEHPGGMGAHIPVDPAGRTEVPGVWAAGNVTDLGAQVGAAAAVYHRQYTEAMQLTAKFGRAGSRRVAGSLAGNGVTGRRASAADACRADG